MADALIILMYVLMGLALVVGVGLLYMRSAASRRDYCCPQCGQRVRVELMRAQHCNVCGAPLRRPMHRGDAQ